MLNIQTAMQSSLTQTMKISQQQSFLAKRIIALNRWAHRNILEVILKSLFSFKPKDSRKLLLIYAHCGQKAFKTVEIAGYQGLLVPKQNTKIY